MVPSSLQPRCPGCRGRKRAEADRGKMQRASYLWINLFFFGQWVFYRADGFPSCFFQVGFSLWLFISRRRFGIKGLGMSNRLIPFLFLRHLSGVQTPSLMLSLIEYLFLGCALIIFLSFIFLCSSFEQLGIYFVLFILACVPHFWLESIIGTCCIK